MIIGFAGNMNNLPFILAKYMVDSRYCDIRFLIMEKEPICRPENMFDLYKKQYPEWVLDCSGPITNLGCVCPETELLRAVRLLNGCDYVVLNGLSIGFGGLIHRPYSVFLTGADIQSYANEGFSDKYVFNFGGRWVPFKKSISQFLLKRMIRKQREGISNADNVIFSPEGAFPKEDAILKTLGVGSDRRRYFQYIQPEYFSNHEATPENKSFEILYSARLNWKKPFPQGYSSIDDKGTDIFLSGFKNWVLKNPNISVKLQIVKKGLHVSETMDLAKQLDIEPYIQWLDEMTQSTYLEKCKHADLIVDQIGQSVPGMVAMTGMALGKAVMVKVPQVREYRNMLNDSVCNVSSEEDVEAELEKLINQPGYLEKISSKGYKTALEYFHPERAAQFIIERAQQSNHFEQERSISDASNRA